MKDLNGPRLDHFAVEDGSDHYRDWDAAYVLGSLSPPERRAFEEHLAICAGCRTAVTEIAGMPRLLAQVSPGAVILTGSATTATGEVASGRGDAGADDEGPGDAETLTSRVERPDRQRRRLARAAAVLAAASVLLAGVLGWRRSAGTFCNQPAPASPPFRWRSHRSSPRVVTRSSIYSVGSVGRKSGRTCTTCET
jgi:anti-sigma factor RsiW